MNLMIFGPPGSGKGTQGKLLAERLCVPQVSTGDLLRSAVEHATDLGKKAKAYMDQGLLVPDALIIGLIEEVLDAPESRDGIIMDGFPRTTSQAEAVDRILAARGSAVDRVLLLDVADDEVIRRLLGRAQEQGRRDDTPETIKRRLEVYRQETAPLITYYRDQGKLIDVPGSGSISEIQGLLAEAVHA
jgi:adenylate kinase